MPTYQYACTNPECGNRFEEVQAFTDSAIEICPVCGQRVRKVYGSVGVVFKGSGFYRNDSHEGDKKATAASGGSSTSTDAGSSGSSGSSDSGSSSSSSGSADSGSSSGSSGSAGAGGSSGSGASGGSSESGSSSKPGGSGAKTSTPAASSPAKS